MQVQIMSPAADRVDFTVPPAPRLASLKDTTIGLYNNLTGTYYQLRGVEGAPQPYGGHDPYRFREDHTHGTCKDHRSRPSAPGAG